IISGIFIVIFRPFRVGDNVIIQTQGGIIEDITLRHTIIRNWENRRVIIPNSIISNETVLNSTINETKICNHFEFGISYDSDTDRAKEIVIEEAQNHPNYIDNRTGQDKLDGIEPVLVRILNWGDSSLNMKAYIWTEDSAKGFVLRCDLYESVKKRFDSEGIEFPFPHRTIVTKEIKKGDYLIEFLLVKLVFLLELLNIMVKAKTLLAFN
ncbi:MAG: mechanosensitive ion channel, partial [Melioribacteraceae bacterium]|nr:mechanosensitive ion channel [Melioribacteraceae bacterium]